MVSENEFERMCERIGGRTREQVSGEPTCRSDGALVVLDDEETVVFRDDGSDIVADADTLEVSDRALVAQNGEGFVNGQWYEDARVSFKTDGPNEGVEIISGVGGGPPRGMRDY